MRIEFQYNFNEWLEWNRSSIHSFHLALLQIGDASLMPLTFLCGLSLVMVLLRLANLATAITSHIPVWLPIPILTLVAMVQIYLSRNPHLRRKLVKKEWQNQIANLKYDLEVTEKGIDSTLDDLKDEIPWHEITSVFQTKRLLIFRETDNQVLLIPKRAFTSAQQLEELLELAHQKTVTERK